MHYHTEKFIRTTLKMLFRSKWECNRKYHFTFRSYFEMPKSLYWNTFFTLSLSICVIFSSQIWKNLLFSAFFSILIEHYCSHFFICESLIMIYNGVVLWSHYDNKWHWVQLFWVPVIERVPKAKTLNLSYKIFKPLEHSSSLVWAFQGFWETSQTNLFLVDPKRLLVMVILRSHYHNKWHSVWVFASFRYEVYSQNAGIGVKI